MTSPPPGRYPEPNEEFPQATRLDDVRIREVRPIISPALLQYELPADAAVQRFIEDSRTQVANVVHGMGRAPAQGGGGAGGHQEAVEVFALHGFQSPRCR